MSNPIRKPDNLLPSLAGGKNNANDSILEITDNLQDSVSQNTFLASMQQSSSLQKSNENRKEKQQELKKDAEKSNERKKELLRPKMDELHKLTSELSSEEFKSTQKLQVPDDFYSKFNNLFSSLNKLGQEKSLDAKLLANVSQWGNEVLSKLPSIQNEFENLKSPMLNDGINSKNSLKKSSQEIETQTQIKLISQQALESVMPLLMTAHKTLKKMNEALDDDKSSKTKLEEEDEEDSEQQGQFSEKQATDRHQENLFLEKKPDAFPTKHMSIQNDTDNAYAALTNQNPSVLDDPYNVDLPPILQQEFDPSIMPDRIFNVATAMMDVISVQKTLIGFASALVTTQTDTYKQFLTKIAEAQSLLSTVKNALTEFQGVANIVCTVPPTDVGWDTTFTSSSKKSKGDIIDLFDALIRQQFQPNSNDDSHPDLGEFTNWAQKAQSPEWFSQSTPPAPFDKNKNFLIQYVSPNPTDDTKYRQIIDTGPKDALIAICFDSKTSDPKLSSNSLLRAHGKTIPGGPNGIFLTKKDAYTCLEEVTTAISSVRGSSNTSGTETNLFTTFSNCLDSTSGLDGMNGGLNTCSNNVQSQISGESSKQSSLSSALAQAISIFNQISSSLSNLFAKMTG